MTVADTTNDTRPLWNQVLSDLRLRLAANEFAHRFPGDAELVAHYGVSRHTVREAVRRLQADGLLERRRGQGSFVTRTPIEQPIGKPYSLYRSVECAGASQLSVVIVIDERHDRVAETKLGCEGATVVFIERLRLADGEPIALDQSWLPAERARPLLDVDFRHASLCDELAGRCDIRLTSGWERIRPAMPSRRERELLHTGARDPAFEIERLANAGDEAIEWRRSMVRGDRYSFVARWSADRFHSDFD